MAETAMTELPRARLDGRHALVTGASSGLGRHFAEVLACAGARVSLTARRVESLTIAVDAITAAGGSCHAVPLDVTDQAGVKAAFDQAEAWGGPVQILINNAGVATTRTALELAEEDWDTTLDTNLKGAWLVAREAGRRLVAHRAPGTIINIASILGLRVAGSVAAYATSKAGLLQLTRALALEWARHGIRVNAIAPGYIETDLNREFFVSEQGQAIIKRIPQRRLGQPGDLDGALLLLVSDASRYITGSVITVDGGHLVSSL